MSTASIPLAFERLRLDPSSTLDLALVLANARLLQQAVEPPQRHRLLQGKNLALMCESADSADARRFRDAALDLGANVAHLRTGLAEQPRDVRLHTARLLGRLYQGIECQGLPADTVGELASEAGVPVYDGVASATHPFARLASMLDDGGRLDRSWQLIVQAVLVSTIG